MSTMAGVVAAFILLANAREAKANWALDTWAGCKGELMQEYQSSCQKTENRRDRCGVFDSGEIFGMTPLQVKQLLNDNPCLRRKSEACYCLTYVGATKYRQNDFPWSEVAIHGNYCGWRSADRNADGTALNWNDKSEIQYKIARGRGIDALDEACREHDFDYDDPAITICQADEKAISKMIAIALNRTNGTPRQIREQSLAMAGALIKNRKNCAFLSMIK